MILLMTGNWSPSPEHLRRLEALAGPGRVVVAGDEAGAVRAAGGAEVVVGHRYLRQVLAHAPRLAWVQTSAAGVDQLPVAELARRGVVLTRNPLNAEAIALHALSLLLALVRRLPESLEAQRQGRWGAPPAMRALPRQVLLMGLGAIGQALAPRLRGLGIRVVGCARQGTPAQRALCDGFVAAPDWRDALPASEGLILAMPLDGQSAGMVDADALARLAPGALLINVARAGLVHPPALLEALESGRLGGAALDVLDPVPPPEAPLWRTPGLLITPKVAAYHPDMQRDFEAFTERQLSRYLQGMPLEAVVAPREGP
ncbi:NAD(P)-dependent oxidoreductase [Zoogloea sp.]|uniref:NAD(P)-dependent oxidoreductase n=1 Tax=Zoogloea sp. TaxID=49181 RepID=UPI001415D14F|nr:MAG: dehydrogenase [Zoogloea sp.]